MNKFIALLAVVTCASVAVAMKEVQNEEMSELSISTTDADEIEGLKPDYRVFENFCLESRDIINAFLNSKATDPKLAKMYALLFGTTHDLQTELLKVDSATIDEGRRIIMEAAVQPASQSPQDKAASFEQTMEKIQLSEPTDLAVKSIMSAMLDTMQSDVYKKMMMLRKKFSPEEVDAMFEETCQSLKRDLFAPISERFSKIKKSLPINNWYKYSSATMSNVGCLSTTRLLSTGSLCAMHKIIGASLSDIMNVVG